MAELWLFLVALAVVYLLPGPDMILLLQTGARQGKAMALATAEGSTTIFTGSNRAMALATRAKSCCTCANVTPQVVSHNA